MYLVRASSYLHLSLLLGTNEGAVFAFIGVTEGSKLWFTSCMKPLSINRCLLGEAALSRLVPDFVLSMQIDDRRGSPEVEVKFNLMSPPSMFFLYLIISNNLD